MLFSVFYLSLFLSVGLLSARRAVPDGSAAVIVPLGCGFGVSLLAVLPALFAVVLGFTLPAVALAAAAAAGIGAALLYRGTRLRGMAKDPDSGALWACLLPVVLITLYLLHTHVLHLVDGAYHTGQSCYGDMPMHLGFIKYIAQSGEFLPRYPLLGGTHPSRGVSAVGACELAASLETLLACPGGEFGADQLETLMYNTIDAAFSPDGRGVQPMQQANQAMLSRAARFPLCGEDAGLFSLEDGDALCSLLSAWPRFVQAQWMISRDDGLCAMGYAPCSVRYRLSGASVRVDVESDYPASGSVHITVHTDTKAAFPIHLRIPEWANGATVAVDGEILPAQAGGFVTLNRDWQDGDEILLTLPMAVRRLPAFHQAVSVARGPLRFAYAPKTVEHEDTLSAEIGFAVALVGGEEIRVVEHMDGSVVLAARVAPLPRWGMRAASCDQPPIVLSDADVAKAFDAELVPYAEAVIRLAVLPVL